MSSLSCLQIRGSGLTGSIFHTALRWLAVIVTVGFLFGCAGPPTRPLPEKGAPGAGAKAKLETRTKAGQEAGARPAEKARGSAKKAIVASKMPEAKKPEPAEVEPVDTASSNDPTGVHPLFRYDYYPDREVYFDTDRHLYFYRTGGEWSMSVALPISFQAHLGTSVQLRLETPRPYEFHDQNRKAFPSGTGGRDF